MHSTKEERRAICDYYSQVKSVRKVAIKFIRSETLIRRIIKGAGLFEPIRFVTEEEKELMRMLRAKGYRAERIAYLMNFDKGAVFDHWGKNANK